MIKNLIEERIKGLNQIAGRYKYTKRNETDIYRKSKLQSSIDQINKLLDLNTGILNMLNGTR